MENNKKEIYGYIHSLESFGSVDGPGVRFIIFTQGCKMRCAYCHNPDTWNTKTGTRYTPKQLIEQALRYRSYWGKKGGITVSGGEPLLQLDFMIELWKEAKKAGIHTVIDTSGNPFSREPDFMEKFEKLMENTDLLLLDIKHIDEKKHKSLTGCSNRNILQMAEYLSEIGKPVWIRHVLVPEYSDKDEDLQKLDQFIGRLTNVQRVEILPYHNMAAAKYKELGIPYKLKEIKPPSKERIENANRLLHTEKYKGYQK